MINITTFLDANACRLDKPVYYSIDREKRYNSRDILGIISEIGRKLIDLWNYKRRSCTHILAQWTRISLLIPSTMAYRCCGSTNK